MQIKISQRDDVLRRFGNRLASLGEDGANTVMMRALNHEGDKVRTQVKRALVRQTGIQYGKINHAVRTISAYGSRLTYTIEGRGGETNLNLFNARQGKRGVSASPWGRRRVFRHTFMIKSKSNRVYSRVGKERFPIEQKWGPNIAREMLKDEVAETFRLGTPMIADRVAHEIDHFLRT